MHIALGGPGGGGLECAPIMVRLVLLSNTCNALY